MNEIICADCLEVLKSMPDKSVDLVLTDPPYGIGADKKNAHSSIRDNPAWADVNWDVRPSKEHFDEMLRVGKKVAIWGGNYFTDYLPVSSGWFVWEKPQADSGFSLADGELCWTSETFSLRIKKFTRTEGVNRHPTQKPVELMRWCLSKLRNEGDTILDPFCGSGTTCVAAKILGRKYIGIEISPVYAEIARKRVEQAQYEEQMFPMAA